jgi:methylaspartate mutase epsilon subunit
MRLQAYSQNRMQIQPRGGRSNPKLQLDLMKALQTSGADVLPVTIDSNTRLGRLEEARKLYLHSLATGTETLNGFPLLAVDPEEVERLLSQLEKPVSLRHGSPLSDQLVQRALLLGFDEIEGGPLTYSLPYSRSTPIAAVLQSWKLVEEMCSQSISRFGNPILRESFGVLTAVLVHPYIALLASFLEAIFAKLYGVRHFMIGLQSTGNVQQDFVQFEAARRIHSHLGTTLLNNVEIYYAYHHWMGPFPKDQELANRVIDICNFSAHLNSVDKVVVKTAVEAHGIPTAQANCDAVSRTKRVLGILHDVLVENWHSELTIEIDALSAEVISGIYQILNLSEDLETCITTGLDLGMIDLMFSPHHAVRKESQVCRDDRGWLRFFDPGGIRLSKDFIFREQSQVANHTQNLTSEKIQSDMLWPENQGAIDLVRETVQILEVIDQ